MELLSVTNSDRDDSYLFDEELQFWSLIDTVACDSRLRLRPDLANEIKNSEDATDLLRHKYCLRGRKATDAMNKLCEFLRANCEL